LFRKGIFSLTFSAQAYGKMLVKAFDIPGGINQVKRDTK
jgi:hypothetical protein